MVGQSDLRMRTWAKDIDGAADDTNEGAGDIDREGGLYNMVARLLERIEGVGGTFDIVEPGEPEYRRRQQEER